MNWHIPKGLDDWLIQLLLLVVRKHGHLVGPNEFVLAVGPNEFVLAVGPSEFELTVILSSVS